MDIVHRAVGKVRDRIRGRREALFAHPRTGPEIPCRIVPDVAPDGGDVAIAERLLAAYRRARQDEPGNGDTGDVWAEIRQIQQQYFAVLDGGDPRALAAYLCNMSRHDATHGTVQGNLEHARLAGSAAYRGFVARMSKDKLVSLAEAVGALALESPEQGPWGRNFDRPIEELVDLIEGRLGMPITPPDIDGGLLKIVSGRGLFHERDCNAIYTGWLLSRTLAQTGGSTVAEIGGGVGRVAHWATRFGAAAHSIFDLPHINVLQGFYLAKTLPQVALYGEAAGPVSVLPYFSFPAARADLVLNQDSFPEIHRDIVTGYLQSIRSNAGRFLSINHENEPLSRSGVRQVSVPKLIDQLGGFRLISRNLYWLREGYCAELYATGG